MEFTLLKKLSPDILLLIMKSVPDFGTLNSLVRSSRLFRHLLEVNEYGICGAISKKLFGPLWGDARQLLFLQHELKRDSEIEWDIRKLFEPSGGGDELGVGILSGGTKVGIAESVEFLKYAERINLGEGKLILQAGEAGEYVYNYPSVDIMRTDRAVLRLWSLLLTCGPDWVEERAMMLHHNHKISHYADSEGVMETHTSYERQNSKTSLCYSLGDLEDMWTISYAAWYIWSGFPGTIKEGGAHYWEVWEGRDDTMVQLKAEVYLWNKIVECREALAQAKGSRPGYQHSE